jgi:hypothetical protein
MMQETWVLNVQLGDNLMLFVEKTKKETNKWNELRNKYWQSK